MDCGHDQGGERGVRDLAAVLGDPEVPAEERLGGGPPSKTRTCGSTTPISASSQGRHARMWLRLGLRWIRRFPRASQLKCFTAFVR